MMRLMVVLCALAAVSSPAAVEASGSSEASSAPADTDASHEAANAATAPWQLGPAPSAHRLQVGGFVDATVNGMAGGYQPLSGARVRVGVTPTWWIHGSLAYERRAAWRMCPDCRTDATVLTLRGSLIRRSPYVQVSPWLVTQLTQAGALDALPGLSIDAGSRRVRVDVILPVWSTYDELTTLRVVPEAGVTARWTEAHSTRLAVAGADLALGLEHRWRVGERWTVTGGLRHGEEGTGAELGARFGW